MKMSPTNTKCSSEVQDDMKIPRKSRILKDKSYLNYARKRSEGANRFLNEKIVRFFEENSRMLPGKKDFKKKRKLTRQLMYSEPHKS